MSETLWVRHGRLPGKRPVGWDLVARADGPLREPTAGPPSAGRGLRDPDAEFWRDLRDLNRRLGAGSKALSLLDQVAEGKADVVLTGQQPGLLGGPLYTYLKLATAGAVASRWTAAAGRPVVPVFWGVTDDTDHGEVSWTLVPDDLLAPRKVSLPAVLPGTRVMVGSLPREAWSEALEQVDGPARRDDLSSRIRDLPGDDWGELFLALLLELAAPFPLIVVDGRRRALLEAARPLFDRYLSARREVASHVRAGAEAVAASGERPTLEQESGESALFTIRGNERVAYADGDVGTLSPNVVLRPLTQAFLFPLRAVIVGDGEIAYRAQLGSVYETLGVDRPALVPRFRATLLPPLAAKLPEGARLADWATDPGEARRRLETVKREDELVRLLKELRGALSAALGALSRIGEEEDRSYPQMVQSGEKKILQQIARLEEGLRGKARSRWFKDVPGLANAADFLRPRDKPQERGLGVLALPGLYGPQVYGELNRWVETWVDEWVGPDGDWSTWVLGPPDDGG